MRASGRGSAPVHSLVPLNVGQDDFKAACICGPGKLIEWGTGQAKARTFERFEEGAPESDTQFSWIIPVFKGSNCSFL